MGKTRKDNPYLEQTYEKNRKGIAILDEIIAELQGEW